jgi:CheY-like chemotaxis protein
LGLYRFFLSTVEAEGSAAFEQPTERDKSTFDILSNVHFHAREAILLTATEGFSTEDAAYVMQRSSEQVSELVAEALALLKARPSARILIVEDEPIIAMDLERILIGMGHLVTGVAITREEALEAVKQNKPDLMLMDIQLADDSSGIDVVRDIHEYADVPVIFVTAFPERLLIGPRAEPTFLVTKPFNPSTIEAVVEKALLSFPIVHPFERVGADREKARAATETSVMTADELLEVIRATELREPPSPVRTRVIGGQLRRIADGRPLGSAGESGTNGLRALHHATAARLCDAQEASNLGMPFAVRMAAVRDALSEEFDDSRALQLGVQIEGLRDMLPVVRERLTSATAVDIERFILDAGNLAWSFPIYREFVASARDAPRLDRSAQDALVEVAKVIEGQPDDTVQPHLKVAIAAARVNAEDGNDPVAELGLQRVIGDIWRALVLWLRDRRRGTADNFNKTLDKSIGGTGAALFAALLIIVPGITVAQAALPRVFPLAEEVGKLVKLLIP